MPHRRVSPHAYPSGQHAFATNAGARLAARGLADYTLTHGGRQVRLGPIAFWVTVGTLVIMAVWTITTATYFAFRDDVLTRLIARQAEMQFGYEDRIADLRAQIDRISSRQLLDQEQYEQKLDQMLRRQAVLESRTSTLNSLYDPGITGSIGTPKRGEPKRPPRIQLNDKSLTSPSTMRTTGVVGTLSRLQAALDRIEATQAASLASMETDYDGRTRHIRDVLNELGIDADKTRGARGVGGPFTPPRLRNDADAFERQMHRVSIARAQFDRLTRALYNVPVRRPLARPLDTTSGFGMRIDPFIKAPAMHTGLDFRGEPGDEIRAAAAGKVTVAGWHGGYGRMVEIDHGNGLATRYGHMSTVDVTVGQTVRSGQLIGRVGSTGRSTGPHLHYETRVDGDAVDPQKFLRAGKRLGNL
jgi:murein DD-endopeptidase MepM/ murein hydrolase activator NlpD